MRAAAILLALLLAGCYAGDPIGGEGGDGINRWHDPDYQVVCWFASHRMSCLPEREVVPR